MIEPIVQVDNLSKRYRIGGHETHNSLRDSLSGLFTSGKAPKTEEFWALQDVSFQIMPGESVGIIGRNGAGKSTLLKILSQITPPTKGKITMGGRVASLLEVGTGFHPELTGRENIYLNGAILGMPQREIEAKFDEIVAFAEIDKFLDTPIKRYSSGMYVRLAFAVAAHLDPDILVVDEVLAVGDAQFQQKCLGKMEAIGKEGRTILFVSHNLSAISAFCKRAILLRDGRLVKDGPVMAVIDEYMDTGTEASYESMPTKKVTKPRIARAWLESAKGKKVTQLMSGEPFRLVSEIDNPDKCPLEFATAFFDGLRRPLWNFAYAMQGLGTMPTDPHVRVIVEFAPPPLTVHDMTIDLAIGPKGGTPYIDHIIDAMKCPIIDNQQGVMLPRYPEWPIYCSAKVDYQKIQGEK